jgi:hypothetical protein
MVLFVRLVHEVFANMLANRGIENLFLDASMNLEFDDGFGDNLLLLGPKTRPSRTGERAPFTLSWSFRMIRMIEIACVSGGMNRSSISSAPLIGFRRAGNLYGLARRKLQFTFVASSATRHRNCGSIIRRLYVITRS